MMMYLENVSYQVQNGLKKRTLLDCLNYSFMQSKITTISGPSGSGKTTVLQVITGLISSIEGKVILDGCCINHMKTAQRDLFPFMNGEYLITTLFNDTHSIKTAQGYHYVQSEDCGEHADSVRLLTL